METIPKERLQRIGIQDDISVTIKRSSIIIPFAAYGSIAVAAAVIIYLFLQMDHHGIVTKIQYNGCGGQCALGSWSGRNREHRGARRSLWPLGIVFPLVPEKQLTSTLI
ncbi:MAG: hypothetical protein M3178_10110 [Pseudomonadota bacterium]|nr:hypothetical protein [Pseudomonadota bacterium]